MKLKCKKSSFTKTTTLGLGPLKRDETKSWSLPLTEGKEYEVQIYEEVDTDSFSSLFNSNMLIKMNPVLVVFTDKKEWQAISLKSIIVDEAIEQKDKLNRLIKTIFEDPQ